jgi:hypothetical protein
MREWDEDDRSMAASWGGPAHPGHPHQTHPEHHPSSMTGVGCAALSRGQWMRLFFPESDPWVILRRPPDWPEEQYRDHDFEPRPSSLARAQKNK